MTHEEYVQASMVLRVVMRIDPVAPVGQHFRTASTESKLSEKQEPIDWIRWKAYS